VFLFASFKVVTVELKQLSHWLIYIILQVSSMKLNLSILFVILISFPSLSNQSTQLTCYSTTYAPYSFDEDGVVKGIDIDIIQYIAENIGVTVSFKIIPWARLKQTMLTGNIDCAMAFLKDSEYAKQMIFMSHPITVGEYTIFVKKNNENQFKRFADLYGFTIGVNRGFKTPIAFQQAVSKGLIKKYDVGNEQQSFQMLLASRVDGVLTDKNVGLFNLQQMEIENTIALSKALASTPVFLVFSKKWQDNGIVDKFNHSLKAMQRDGTYQKIFDKYLTDLGK
jgi:polar amino acid transport system substrate-binding protein